MLVEVPSTYRAAYVRKGKRTKEYATMRTVVEAEVREVDPVDAPIAHVIGERRVEHETSVGPDFVPFAMVGGRPIDVRVIDGEFYARRMSADEFVRAAGAVDFANPFAGYYTGEGGAYVEAGPRFGLDPENDRRDDRHDLLPWDRDGFESELPEPIRKWEDLRHVTVAAITARASELAIVDGCLYERVGEPALTLSMRGDKVALSITEAGFDRSRFRRGNPLFIQGADIRFGIDELPRALAEGERLAAAAGVPFEVLCEVEQHSPWHVRFRGEPELLSSRAWSLLEVLTPHVTAFSPLLGKAWHDLATAFFEHPGCTLPAIDAVRRVLAMREEIERGIARADGTYGYSADRMITDPRGLLWRLDAAETALHMWDTRNADGIIWTENGLGITATHEGRAKAWEVTDLMEADRLASSFGADIAHMVAAAASGRSSLVAVSEAGVPRALCSVEAAGGAPKVTETVASHGAEASRHHVALVERHVARALAAGMSPAMERDLEALGL